MSWETKKWLRSLQRCVLICLLVCCSLRSSRVACYLFPCCVLLGAFMVWAEGNVQKRLLLLQLSHINSVRIQQSYILLVWLRSTLFRLVFVCTQWRNDQRLILLEYSLNGWSIQDIARCVNTQQLIFYVFAWPVCIVVCISSMIGVLIYDL